MRALAEPDPYRANPFRVLGLPALADAGETFARIEEQHAAAERGERSGDWAFAPPVLPLPEDIRAAAQTLHDPSSRFICEFFWFWPLSYPESAPDPAVLALAAGDTATATRLWSEAPPASAAALHNLAVYQHVLALDWETDPAVDPVQLAELRASAAELWLAALAASDLPALLAARLARLGAPRPPASLAQALLGRVPETLARIHVGLALRHAEHDRLADAGQQLGLAHTLLPASDALSALLDEAPAAGARRLRSGLPVLAGSGSAPLDLAAWIVALANAAIATGRPEEETWARSQLARALEDHPAGTLASERLSAALAHLALADSFALSISGPANTFSLDRSGIALDGQAIAASDLTALRLGPDHSPAGAGRVLLAWSSARQAHALYLDQLQNPEAPDADLDRRVRDAVDYFLIPPLAARVEAALLAGKRVAIGPLTLTHAGIQIETQRLLGAKTRLISFANAQIHTTTDGCLLVADPAHPVLHTPVDPAATWNALLIPHLIARFAAPARERSP